MVTKDYDSRFIEYVMRNMGEAFCFVQEVVCQDLDAFMVIFTHFGVAKEIESGNPTYIYGMSGTEWVYKTYELAGLKINLGRSLDKSHHLDTYWTGYILAYYQFKTGLSFQYIHDQLSVYDIRKLYYPLHEASEDKAVDVINKLIKRKYVTRLQQRRKLVGLSQSELAKASNVNIRTLQEYEIGTKDINKASALTVYNLSKALNCKVEDILELI